MKRKKKAIITLLVIMSVLLCAGIGAYVWYINSPFVTVTKLMSAVKAQDADTVLEYIEPDVSKKIQMLLRFTGISPDILMKKIIPSGQNEESSDTAETQNTSIKFSGYSRDGDTACIAVTVADTNEAESLIEFHFVRILDTWYLTMNSDWNIG